MLVGKLICVILIIIFCRDDPVEREPSNEPLAASLTPDTSLSTEYSSPELQTPPQIQSITSPCTWSQVIGNLKNLAFTEPAGITDYCIDQLNEYQPIYFYNLFVDDVIINLLVIETNKYALQCIVTGILND